MVDEWSSYRYAPHTVQASRRSASACISAAEAKYPRCRLSTAAICTTSAAAFTSALWRMRVCAGALHDGQVLDSSLMGHTVYAAYFQACVFWVHCVFSDSPNTQPSFESAGALHIVYCVFSIHTWRVPVYFEGGCVLRIAYCVLGAPF